MGDKGARVQRLVVDHTAGKSGRDAVLVDEAGRTVLGMSGAWAVTDDARRTVLFLAPDFGGIAKSAVIGGIIDGVLGFATSTPARSRNAGPGRQTVKRARVPARGMPPRWTPVATVTRESTEVGDVAYSIEPQEEDLPPVRFVRPVEAASLAGYANGFGDPAQGVWDLVHIDGRTVLRHWATIDKDRRLKASTFDIEDSEYPLGEAVMLCLARFSCWRD
ncbi:MAG: hypothetical protein ACHQNA_00095 [Acidimicrobiales bacterium]